jgi:hypothetical protein
LPELKSNKLIQAIRGSNTAKKEAEEAAVAAIAGLDDLMASLGLKDQAPAAAEWFQILDLQSVQGLKADRAAKLAQYLKLPADKALALVKTITDAETVNIVGDDYEAIKKLAETVQSVASPQSEQTPAATTAWNQAPAALTRPKRWGDGLEAPAAGKRIFVPQGFVVAHDVRGAIERCGHSSEHVARIMESGRAKASTATTALSADHASAIYAYTEETQLYSTLNYTMRTPHTPSSPTDTQLKQFADYIVHAEGALGSLPTHVSEVHGPVYRGINALLNPSVYAPGKTFTWQAFSSSTKKQTSTLDFVDKLPGRKLQGSLFVIHSTTAKDIRHFSAIPSEEEVLFPPNSQFSVQKVVTSETEKKALLDELGAYDLTELDVYMLKQLA